MKAKLVSFTQPVEELKDMGIDDAQELIAYCARVSNPGGQINTETSEKLIKYLIKHKHWSPLEMVDATLEVEITRDIGRQLLRHGFRFQEFSQRYADVTQLEFVTREARLQHPTNRQASVETEDYGLQIEWERRQQQIIRLAKEHYQWALDNRIAKEQARVILPEGNTMSKLYVKGDIRRWIHYIELRSGHGTQKEHVDLAVACAEAIHRIFPMVTEYVNET